VDGLDKKNWQCDSIGSPAGRDIFRVFVGLGCSEGLLGLDEPPPNLVVGAKFEFSRSYDSWKNVVSACQDLLGVCQVSSKSTCFS